MNAVVAKEAFANVAFSSEMSNDTQEFSEMSNDTQKFMELQTKFAETVSTMISGTVKRDYLDEKNFLKILPCGQSDINKNKIFWLKINEVGIFDENSIENLRMLTEQLLQTMHLPDSCRVIFAFSSDGFKVDLRLGLQSTDDTDAGKLDVFVNCIEKFAKTQFAGLECTLINDDKHSIEQILKYATPGKDKNPGAIRCITGIPALREKNENFNVFSIDHLINALLGYEWTYLVIATPVDNKKITKTIDVCKGLAGRIESMKSMQLGKNTNYSESHSDSQSEQIKTMIDMLGSIVPIAVGVAGGGFLGYAGTSALFGALKDGKSETHSDSISVSNGVSFGQNIISKHAEVCANMLDEQLKRLTLATAIGGWDVGVYFVGESDTVADTGVAVIKALSSGDNSSFEPLRSHDLSPFDWVLQVNEGFQANVFEMLGNCENPNILAKIDDNKIIEHPFDCGNEMMKCFSQYRTMLNTRELTQFINLPTQSVPGVIAHSVISNTGLSFQEGKDKQELGKQIYRGEKHDKYPYYISKDILAKHSLVCGISRSGKTNTVKVVLQNLLSDESKIPFLVVEPAKQEYVTWAIEHNNVLAKKYGSKEEARKSKEWINIYIPGCEKYSFFDCAQNNHCEIELEKLYLNPFDFVWLNENSDPKTLEHIDRLKTVINAALPMQEILPVLMEELIYAVYSIPHSPRENDGKYPCWLPKNNISNQRYPRFDEKLFVPNFQELAAQIPVLFKRLSYAQDVSRNLRAALETRIDSFKRGWRKELLNKNMPRNSAENWEKLFNRPTVINLTSLTSDEDKAFFMSVILMFLYEYRQADAEITPPAVDKLKHLFVIEEAHRILNKCETASVLSANPRQKVSEMFSNMISEVGAYGQGVMIADQVPSRLNDDAIKNTNLKIVHRLVSADDRSAMATALNLRPEQERIIGELRTGEVLLRGDMDKDVYMVKVNKA